MAKVVLDAGHGGYDNGASNGTRREKDDNLRMTLAVGNILKNCGVDVVYTRSTDVFIPLLERSAISNAAHPDLFVSFHRNSSVNPAGNGAETWVYTRPSSKAVAAAKDIQNGLVSAGVQANRGIQYGNFSVLRHTVAPSVLVENGFISNTEDNKLFDANFNQYAQKQADAIMNALGVKCGSAPTTPPPSNYKEVIKYIQQTLNGTYGQNLVTDGIWGPLSHRALLRALQTELNRQFNAGLATDGLWGPKTRAAIRNLRQGDRGNLVWILQAALYAHGYKTTPDGIFGPATAEAVRSFQRANGLTADGIAGPATFEKLFTR